ncbi:MAG: hypothetical protein EZS28_009717 [Streblomastix strix]|uniref:Tyr recombinase domain-containing protein n=1 Tax=Streblomastix strix TaxID=222440 RepID=A0A5J4WI59_9EUKA|nr:MAG: hypothetical protein EZS28_009717 [Streblomastix strix]
MDKAWKIQFFYHLERQQHYLLTRVEKGRIFQTQILDRIGLSKGVQQLLINGQSFETQRHYLCSMRTLAEFSYKLGLSIEQFLLGSPDILLLEVLAAQRQRFSRFRNTKEICIVFAFPNNSIEQYEIRRTGDPKVCPNSTMFTLLNRLYWHYGMDPEHFANLFWQPDGQPVDKQRIILWLSTLLREIDIRGVTIYSFKHAASTELARQGHETSKLNILTHYGTNEFASQLVGSHGQSYATQTISQQRGGAIERGDINALPGCYQQHSGNSTLSRSSTAQSPVIPFYEILLIGRGIEPTDNTRDGSDMIYIDQYDNNDTSRQRDQWSSWNVNGLEHRIRFDKDKQQQQQEIKQQVIATLELFMHDVFWEVFCTNFSILFSLSQQRKYFGE